MTERSQQVKDIGEQGLLKKLQLFCPQEVIGDDGAILPTAPDKSLVVTTDVLVEGVHFSGRTTTAFDVGWRAAAANLSDLAAMGATPLGITVGLSLPGSVAVAWVEELYRGMSACLGQYQTAIVGGDVCRSQVVTVAITAFGQVSPHRALRRHNARVQEAIVVTGLHGLSRAGLELLLHPELGTSLTATEKEELIAAHQRPQPRLDILPWLEQVAPELAIAGMDSSDGLADAIIQICACSDVGAIIELNSLVIHPAIAKLVDFETALNWLLYGGEDFELVLCLPRNLATALVEYLSPNAAIVGHTTADLEVKIADNDRFLSSQMLNLTKGFQHF